MFCNYLFETSHYPGFGELYPFLKDTYGFDMEFRKALEGFEWLSWLVRGGHGAQFVVKVGEKGGGDRDVPSELPWRQAMMQHFRKHGVTCQEVVPTTTGQLHCLYEAEDGTTYIIHMLTYLDGVPLREKTPDHQTWFRLGQMIGHLREILKPFHIPGFEKHQLFFQLEKTGDFRKHIGLFEDEEDKHLLTEALDMFDEDLKPNIGQLEKGAIHHDLHGGNIICMDKTTASSNTSHIGLDASREELFSEFGIIDFGDVVESCYVFDLALFLTGTVANQRESSTAATTPPTSHRSALDRAISPGSSHEPNSLVPMGHAIAGYLTTSSLSDLEWEVLLPAVCARLTIVIIVIRQSLPINMANVEQMTRLEGKLKGTLRRLLSLGKESVNETWKDICKGHRVPCS